MKTKAIFLRVSKKELNEKTQLPKILNHFNLKESECIILFEKISGYKKEVQKNRKAFQELEELVANKEIKEVFVYSLERLQRNIDRLLHFYFFCRINGVELFSYLQPEINQFKEDKPIDTFLKYQSVLTNGFMAEQESFLISQRTKKSFSLNDEGQTISYKGNRVGRRSKVNEEIKQEILNLMRSMSYEEIRKEIKEKYDINVSKGYLSKIKNE